MFGFHAHRSPAGNTRPEKRKIARTALGLLALTLLVSCAANNSQQAGPLCPDYFWIQFSPHYPPSETVTLMRELSLEFVDREPTIEMGSQHYLVFTTQLVMPATRILSEIRSRYKDLVLDVQYASGPCSPLLPSRPSGNFFKQTSIETLDSESTLNFFYDILNCPICFY